MALSEKERLLELLDRLGNSEISTIRQLVEKLIDKNIEQTEVEEFLKISESAFSEWDNEEDDIYNDL